MRSKCLPDKIFSTENDDWSQSSKFLKIGKGQISKSAKSEGAWNAV